MNQSGFDRGQRRSNDSRDGKKKGSEVKRELEAKGLSFRNNQGEKHTNETNKRRPLIRSIPSYWSEKDRMIKRGKKERLPYKRSHESRSGRPERKVQKGSEHRTETTERKAQQGGPVRSRKGRERNDIPYIEERTRSSNKNARRGGDQQRQDQERRGTWTKKSLSLEVLMTGYKTVIFEQYSSPEYTYHALAFNVPKCFTDHQCPLSFPPLKHILYMFALRLCAITVVLGGRTERNESKSIHKVKLAPLLTCHCPY
ncbi:uncharacterized protein TNCV_2942591 [Trichonephila clavipes]|nr:uncharacterized protein TNCV_2942591 [Trichonephila clavipes]